MRRGDRALFAYLLTIGAPLACQPINHMVIGQGALGGEGDALKPLDLPPGQPCVESWSELRRGLSSASAPGSQVVRGVDD